jgi:hypothetical protein
VGQTYQFSFNIDPAEILERFARLVKVAGDLWFLPQTRFHVAAGAVILLAIILAAGVARLARSRPRLQAVEQNANVARLRITSWNSGTVVAAAVVAICFLVSAATVLLPVGGFVVYRTAAVPTAVVAIVFLFAVRVIVEAASTAIGRGLGAPTKAADAAVVLVACAALAGSFYSNYLTLELARSEFAYFTGIVRQAIANKSNAIILVDPRPLSLPEDHPVMYDQKGRAIPPYELGCFSGYCLQDGSIVHIAASELGVSDKQLRVFVQREDNPVPGLTCELLTAPKASYPPNASERSIAIINIFRKMAPFTCVTYNLAWHDLGAGW